MSNDQPPSETLEVIDLTNSDEEDNHHVGLRSREDRRKFDQQVLPMPSNLVPGASNCSLPPSCLQPPSDVFVSTNLRTNPYPPFRQTFPHAEVSSTTVCPEANNTEPCSFSNCFVAGSSSGLAAPATGPCPHIHGHCPIGSPSMSAYSNGAPDLTGTLGINYGPISQVPTIQNPIYSSYYSAQLPPAHSHTYAYQAPSRMHPSHQRLWYSHQRNADNQRYNLMRYQMNQQMMQRSVSKQLVISLFP